MADYFTQNMQPADPNAPPPQPDIQQAPVLSPEQQQQLKAKAALAYLSQSVAVPGSSTNATTQANVGSDWYNKLGAQAQQEKDSIAQQAEVKAGLAEQQARSMNEFNTQNRLNAVSFQKQKDAYDAQIAAEMSNLAKDRADEASTRVDPNLYWKNQTTGQNILSAIALGLGGFGAGLKGGFENPVMNYIEKQIDRDIESQKIELAQKGKRIDLSNNLLASLYSRRGNLEQSEINARTLGWENVQSILKQQEIAAQSPLQKAQIGQMFAQVEQKRLMEEEKARGSVHRSVSGGGSTTLGAKLNIPLGGIAATALGLGGPVQDSKSIKELAQAKQAEARTNLANARVEEMHAVKPEETHTSNVLIQAIGSQLKHANGVIGGGFLTKVGNTFRFPSTKVNLEEAELGARHGFVGAKATFLGGKEGSKSYLEVAKDADKNMFGLSNSARITPEGKGLVSLKRAEELVDMLRTQATSIDPLKKVERARLAGAILDSELAINKLRNAYEGKKPDQANAGQ